MLISFFPCKPGTLETLTSLPAPPSRFWELLKVTRVIPPHTSACPRALSWQKNSTSCESEGHLVAWPLHFGIPGAQSRSPVQTLLHLSRGLRTSGSRGLPRSPAFLTPACCVTRRSLEATAVSRLASCPPNPRAGHLSGGAVSELSRAVEAVAVTFESSFHRR